MSSPKRLFRNSRSGRIAGVCAGIAEYLDTDVTLVRLAWVILSIVPGGFVGGFLAYLAAWLIVPDSNEPTVIPAGVLRLTRSMHDRKIAGVCGGLGEYLNIDSTVVRLVWTILTIVPGGIVLGIFAYLGAWFIMPEERAPQPSTASSPAA